MKKFFKSKYQSDSKRPLMESENNNNNCNIDGYERAAGGHDNPVAQNALNTQEEQRLESEEQFSLQELAELLGVDPDASSNTENGSCCSMCPESNSLQYHIVRLIQQSVNKHFPEPPADVDKNLHQHLTDVKETVHKELVKLGPLLESVGLSGHLIGCYHRQTFRHLDALLQNISSPQSSLALIKWASRTYLSQDLLGHPDLQKMDPIKEADLLLLTECIEKATHKLLENVQTEVRGQLEIILQIQRGNEADDELHLDTIMCIEAIPKEAQKISSKLSDRVQEVCFQVLLMFLKSYSATQTERLGKMAKMDNPEMKCFFQTLNNCKNLKLHVQNKGTLLEEAVAVLENLEDSAVKLVMEIIADITESHLKKYFKSENKEFFLLIDKVKNHFSEFSSFQDIQKRVMDDVYKLITRSYLKHLIQSSQSKLRRCWSADFEQKVAEDMRWLHITISDLAPDVHEWNLMLLKVTELVECKSTDMMKLTVGSMQKECPTCSEDRELLPTLLRWNGLCGRQVKEVLKVLDVLRGYESRPFGQSVSTMKN
ncbi:exocyst complex component 3-like protein 4 isoform X2 [Epinephelus fuscoguttatus]|uniref:exocyst complex component 3-like protein 4 isoform X2 n=1 Tax=Epinephelus fuscoguttatus TaxID=293821 RepID=UPI0020D0994C|nr:exocyst complex component 3-like protein 4 isoform X2 [Epinephelus fuscoguttatus]